MLTLSYTHDPSNPHELLFAPAYSPGDIIRDFPPRHKIKGSYSLPKEIVRQFSHTLVDTHLCWVCRPFLFFFSPLFFSFPQKKDSISTYAFLLVSSRPHSAPYGCSRHRDDFRINPLFVGLVPSLVLVRSLVLLTSSPNGSAHSPIFPPPSPPQIAFFPVFFTSAF